MQMHTSHKCTPHIVEPTTAKAFTLRISGNHDPPRLIGGQHGKTSRPPPPPISTRFVHYFSYINSTSIRPDLRRNFSSFKSAWPAKSQAITSRNIDSPHCVMLDTMRPAPSAPITLSSCPSGGAGDVSPPSGNSGAHEGSPRLRLDRLRPVTEPLSGPVSGPFSVDTGNAKSFPASTCPPGAQAGRPASNEDVLLLTGFSADDDVAEGPRAAAGTAAHAGKPPSKEERILGVVEEARCALPGAQGGGPPPRLVVFGAVALCTGVLG